MKMFIISNLHVLLFTVDLSSATPSFFILLSTGTCSLVDCFQVIIRGPPAVSLSTLDTIRPDFLPPSPSPSARPPLYCDDYAASPLSD